MGMSFGGIADKLKEASVKRAQLVEEEKIAPAGEVRIAMDARVDEERKTGLRTAEQIAVIEDYGHTGDYWKTEGGTLTQTHPGLMNPTEFYFWKRKQAGLGVSVAPSQHAESEAAIQKTFGMASGKIQRPSVSVEERRESAAESKAIAYKAAVGRSEKVAADEYIAHHAQHFGTKEAASLGVGLHNIYGDEYSVLTPKEGVNVVIDSGKNEAFVISDTTLSEQEKQSYVREMDRAGDTPNRPIFIESGREPVVASSGGGGTAIGGGMLLVVIGIIVAIWYLFTGRR